MIFKRGYEVIMNIETSVESLYFSFKINKLQEITNLVFLPRDFWGAHSEFTFSHIFYILYTEIGF